MYFATTSVVERDDVITRPVYKDIIVETMKDIIVDSLNFCVTHKGLVIYGWVLMTNHLHLLIGCDEEHSISDIIRDFKSFTSKEIYKAISQNTQESRKNWMLEKFKYEALCSNKHKGFMFWQEHTDIVEIFTYDFYMQKLNYIHQNPVKQGIVSKPEDYVYSSAYGFNTANAIIPIEQMEL